MNNLLSTNLHWKFQFGIRRKLTESQIHKCKQKTNKQNKNDKIPIQTENVPIIPMKSLGLNVATVDAVYQLRLQCSVVSFRTFEIKNIFRN